MKDEMMKILEKMMEKGYCLFDETAEHFIDRMISYGFDTNFMQECYNRHYGN